MFRRGFKASCEETASNIRRKLKLTAIAPVTPVDVARLMGVPILEPKDLSALSAEVAARLGRQHSESWSAITVSDGNVHLIVINPTHAPSRTNSSLAHELAHLILGHEPSIMFVMPHQDVALRTHNKEQEDEANWLSGCILLPREALLRTRHIGMEDEEVCATYGVSPAMLRFRLNATGVDSQVRRAKSYGSRRS